MTGSTIGLVSATQGEIQAAGDRLPDAVFEEEMVQLLPRKRTGPARIITVVAGKSGTGKSTVVSNLAAMLARDHGLATAVLDLDLQFGDQSLMFDAPSSPSIIDLLVNAGALTPDFVLDCMHQGAGVRILGAPPSPELADLVSAAHVQAVVADLKVIFDVVLIDTSGHLSDIALEAIDMADALVVITTPYLASVKNTKLLLKTMSDLGIPPQKLVTVLNRMEPGLKMSTEVLESNLKFPISVELPHTPTALIESVTDGVPLAMTRPSAEWGQRISELGRLVLEGEDTGGKRKRGFLGLRR